MTKAYPQRSRALSISSGGTLPDRSHAPISLVEVLRRAAQQEIDNPLIFLDPHGLVTISSYGRLLENSSRVLAGLRQFNLSPGSKILLLLENNLDILDAFWGCILGGFVPVIIEVPPPGRSLPSSLAKLADLAEFLAVSLSIVPTERSDIIDALCRERAIKSRFIPLENLRNHPLAPDHFNPRPDDIALAVLSSGSTGKPKCIELTHRNLIVRATGANALARHRSDEIALNWLPFDHIGSISDWHIRCLLLGCRTVYAPKELVLSDILQWIELINRFGVTHSWAPTFAYHLLGERLSREESHPWDLSRVRCLLMAGETIARRVVEKCRDALAVYGMPETAIRSAFGMAELASGVTYLRPEDGVLRFYRPSPSRSRENGPIVDLAGESSEQRDFADLGAPIPGITLRIVDGADRVLPPGKIGHVQARGDVVFAGYYNNPEANRQAFTEDGWFRTGDLGFLRDGRLALTGRAKEVIIINGVNYSVTEIEGIVEKVPGINASCTAVCGLLDGERGGEKVAIFFSRDGRGYDELRSLIQKIKREIIDHLGIHPDLVLPVPESAIPRTSIGKIQRFQLRQKFECGEFAGILQEIDRLFLKNPIVDRADLERQIAGIWQTVLEKNHEEIQFQDNFFELGGTSLHLAKVQYLLEEKLHLSLGITDLFRYPTISSLARYLHPSERPESQPNPRPRTRLAENCDVAVIGMAGSFPGADTVKEFWRNLCQGVESIDPLTDEEILAAGVDAELLQKAGYVKRGPLLKNIEHFDADFFGYTAKEAELLDPQQRLFLESAWESLEDAGYDPHTYPGSIGVYAGAGMNTYLLNNIYPNRHHLDANDPLDPIDLDSLGGFRMMVANDKDYLTTRVSYKLNLTGPSVNVQTACSTSLSAIHLACQSLLARECDLAIAGGVSIQVPQTTGHLSQEGMILSPDGHCRAFDERAAGTVFGNGVGVVVLKPLETALADGDRIYAVVKGSAMVNDGAAKVGYLAPSGEGQARAVALALLKAGVEAESIGYVEAHGTGTPLGDPIEVEGLTRAFRPHTAKNGYCALGSVKTNIGHLQIASGIAGFIKAVLAIHHGKIPPSLHFDRPNPGLALDRSPFYVNTSLREWRTATRPRRAGVNSLGIGGTNVHVILEEAPAIRKETPSVDRPLHLLTLSAKTENALRALVDRYDTFLARTPDNFADICYSANTGRARWPYRLAITAESVGEARQRLRSVDFSRISLEESPKIACLFAGQGTRLAGAGYELYRTQPSFRQTLDRCSKIFADLFARSLADVLYSENGGEKLLQDNGYSQAALFAIECALFEMWRSWGIEPCALMGYSLGEYAAAATAGVFSLEDGVKLVASRGRLIQSLTPDGKMVAVWGDEATVREVIAPYPGKIAISAFNGPESLVLSGTVEVIDAVVTGLEKRGIRVKVLDVNRAFHSPLVEPILEEFERVAREITYHPPRLPILSTLTGEWATEAIATADYWIEHLRSSVHFADGIETLHQAGYNIFLECSPRPIVSGMGQGVLETERSLLWLASLRDCDSNWHSVLESLGQLYQRGVEIDWQGFERPYRRYRVELPTYPFQGQRYWFDRPAPEPVGMSLAHPLHPLLGSRIPSPLSDKIFQGSIGVRSDRWLNDHRVNGKAIVPGAVYLEMALAAGKAVLSSPTLVLENVQISQALTLGEETVIVQTIVRDREGETSFEIYSARPNGEDWTRHCSGRILIVSTPPGETVDGDWERSRLDTVISGEIFYDSCRKRGLDYGPSFRGVREIHIGDWEALTKIVFPENSPDELPRYQLHPRLLDACFQTLLATVPDGGTLVPMAVERLTLYRPPASVLWSHARTRPPSRDSIETDLDIFDEGGNLVARVEGLRSKRISGAKGENWRDLLYRVEWIERVPTLSTEILETPGHWVLFADGEGIAETLAERLQANGQTCTIVAPGKDQLSPRSAIEESGENLKGVLYLSLSHSSANGDIETAVERKCTDFLAIVQSLIRRNDAHPSAQSPRLWLITRGARDIGRELPDISSITGAAPWGMAVAIAQEHPELRCTCVDIDHRESSREAAGALWSEIRSSGKEDRVVLRGGIRYVPRLTRATSDGRQPDRLIVTEPGMIENLQWRSFSRRPPSPGEVEIEVRATGLNFRDLLNVLGMYPGEAGELGLECAGEVVRVGAGVTGLKIGDRVMGLVEGGFARYVTVPALWVVPMVDGWTFEEAATVPGSFLTAYLALSELAKLQPGERVLIHAAAGGVGLAAIQLARRIGAEVFATASPGKWSFLQSLGIDRIGNSRTLDFAGEIDQQTGGRGVDVVLNCLSGEFIPDSMAIVATGGRFVEIGKQGILSAGEAAQIRPDIDYFTFDLLEIARSQPEAIRSSLGELRERFEKVELQPLPRRVFPIAEVKTAFRTLQRAKHTGKIVVSRSGKDFPVIGEGSYLIAGGFGALGSLVARWIAEKGVRHLILVGRGEPSPDALETIRGLEEAGTKVLTVSADISHQSAVERVLATLEKDNFPPLRGIVHAAGVLEDRPVRLEENGGLRRVIAPKVFGAWHLHQLTKEMPIDFFLLFSSFASLSGSAGQVGYCAANAFLDALAQARQGAGLPATSINWGAWGRIGMAARQTRRRGIPGMGEIDPIEGLKALEQILASGESQIAIARLDHGDPGFLASPFFEWVMGAASPSSRPEPPRERWDTLPPMERKERLLARVLDAVTRVLGLPNADTIPLHCGFTELGLDSLTSIELRNQLQTTLNLSLPSTIAFDYPDVGRLVDYLAGRLFPPIVGETTSANNGAREMVKDLSDVEAEALLLDELNRLPL